MKMLGAAALVQTPPPVSAPQKEQRAAWVVLGAVLLLKDQANQQKCPFQQTGVAISLEAAATFYCAWWGGGGLPSIAVSPGAAERGTGRADGSISVLRGPAG